MTERTPMEWALRPLQKYFVFQGRAPRAEYWWFYLGTLIAGFLFELIDQLFGGTGMVSVILNLTIIIPWIAVAVRRLHDIDRTGWWLLLPVIPAAIVGALGISSALEGGSDPMTGPMIAGGIAFIAAAVTLFIFTVSSGTEGPNRYGPDPYGPDNLEAVFA